jgi:acetyl esterase/lipase
MQATDEPFGSLPPDAAAALERIGPVWAQDIGKHRDMVVAAYTPLVAAADNGGIIVHRDIPYGAHGRQVLDVFQPAGNPDGADVIVFIHGGAFVRGSKSSNGHIYDNLPYWFARQGCVAANIEYRLAPEATYPEGARDVGAAVAWLQANLARYGGSASRIFLIGHSAGGTHAATLLLDPVLAQHPARQVAGAVLISARLQADVLADNPNAHGVRAYFGDDESLYARRAPGSHAACASVPMMVVVAQYDNPHLDAYGAQFFQDVGRATGRMPRFVQMPRHNHTSLVAHFNSGEEFLGREILRFMGGAATWAPGCS